MPSARAKSRIKIEFVRSGGFAGLRLAASVDTEMLDAKQASQIARLVAESGFFSLPERMPDAATIRDGFEYRVQVSTAADGTHVVVVGQEAVPEQLRPLLDRLTAVAMKPGGTKGPSDPGG